MTTTEPHLTPYEHTRQALHRAATRIIAAWPHAQTDANARGYTSSRFDDERSGSPDGTVVERFALTPDFAAGWLAELGDILIGLNINSIHWQPAHISGQLHKGVDKLAASWQTSREPSHLRPENILISRIITLANKAAMWWPTRPEKGTVVNGVTVGQRGNDVEVCELCKDPAPIGRDQTTGKALNAVVDGRTFHRQCWLTLRASPARPAQHDTKGTSLHH